MGFPLDGSLHSSRGVRALRRPPLSCRTSPPLGGDWPLFSPSPIFKFARKEPAPKLPISPPVGEMSGRTEGGAVERKKR
ncbi:hypothetical protein EB233_12230 [Mesorhizobium erdmanii]|uniref:Propionyl-coenzyme A carboxylase alpha polypeptide n=1 Tax=Mesorhizobium erdmanii TaxID=1777866 RepID=A0A6M7UG44_9HYPH|nr:hypothetical protein EB233_12230 [Mesorhizobium erdmanii]